MSEMYKSPKRSHDEVLVESTLFDEAMMTDMADDVTSVEDVRRQLGIKTPEIITPTDGAFVELGARALAIHQLMNSINYRNKTNGAHMTAETGGSDFNTRQSSPEDTLSGMRFNDSQNKKADQNSIDILNASSAMIATGFHPDSIRFTRNQITSALKNYEGVGPKNVARRKKLDDKIQAVATRQHKSKS